MKLLKRVLMFIGICGSFQVRADSNEDWITCYTEGNLFRSLVISKRPLVFEGNNVVRIGFVRNTDDESVTLAGSVHINAMKLADMEKKGVYQFSYSEVGKAIGRNIDVVNGIQISFTREEGANGKKKSATYRGTYTIQGANHIDDAKKTTEAITCK